MSHLEDGKETNSGSTHWQQASAETGLLLLTLCHFPDETPDYPHAVIPFTDSYERACEDAMRVFAPYTKDASYVRLKYGIRRLDGTYVWSTITEEDWARIVKGEREEIGVFLPNHDSASYDPREVCLALLVMQGNLIYLDLPSWRGSMSILVCTTDLEELRECAWNALETYPNVVKCKNKALIRFSVPLDKPKWPRRQKAEYIANSGALKYYLSKFAQPLRLVVYTN